MFDIKINNFRSLSASQFDFSRINILIGENSSGKSSLIKFILLLKRSIKYTSTSFRYTSELGRYHDLVYLHDESLSISFELKFEDEYIKFFLRQISQLTKKEDWKGIESSIKALKGEDKIVKLSFSFEKDIQISNLVLTSIENSNFGKIEIIRDDKGSDSVIQGDKCLLNYHKIGGEKFELKDIPYTQNGFVTIASGSDVKNRIESKTEKETSLFYEIAFLLISQNYIIETLNNISYINPISSTPERSYDENERQGSIYSVKDIKDVVNILSDETLNKKVRVNLLNGLNKALRSYGILYEVKPSSSEFGPKELKVQVNQGGIWSNIKDVGYGSALQIPIIFHALLGELSGGETIIIEQPELHIHPFLQAKFIETLILLGSKNTYIIETHSVDIIRKLQVMIKKGNGDLQSDSVNIYYFRKPKDISEITKHNINENGKLTPKFPTGFFDTSINLVKELF